MLIFLSLFYFVLIFSFICFDYRFNKDIFSAVKVVSYFAALESFVMLWFALSTGAIEKYIFSTISISYHNYSNVNWAYFLSCFIYLFVVLGVVFGAYSSGRFSKFFSKFFLSITGWRKLANLKIASLMFLSGVLVFIFFLFEIGGLSNLWANIHFRTKITAGFGYLQAVYSFLIVFSFPVFYIILFNRRRYLTLLALLAVSVFVLGALGQRSPVVLLFFILLLTHHYEIKSFKNILNLKIILMIAASIIFMFLAVLLRPGADDGTLVEKFERNVIQRLGTIERQVVVIGYFNKNEYWQGGVYESLLYAFIPRGLYADKPPVDTGMYINYIRQGYDVKPPVAASRLDPTSWPDGYLAGYISFGFFGLVIVCFLSGFFYGIIYRVVVKSNYHVSAIIIYAHVGFMGATPLSPLGIVQILVIIIPFALLGFFSRFRVKSRIYS